MKIKLHLPAILVAVALFASSTLFAFAGNERNITDQTRQSAKASKVFREIMRAPDKAIPKDILNDCECVAVFPSVIKAGFIIGGRGGRGVVSCRTANGWSAPAFLNLGGASFGLQIGAQSTDFILLFMNRDGIDSLLSDKFTLGVDASAAAGPVGRQTGASTDIRMRAAILSYSRSRGLFAGLELKGVVISPDKNDMSGVYGDGVTTKSVLREQQSFAPVAVRTFPTTLGKYSNRPVQN